MKKLIFLFLVIGIICLFVLPVSFATSGFVQFIKNDELKQCATFISVDEYGEYILPPGWMVYQEGHAWNIENLTAECEKIGYTYAEGYVTGIPKIEQLTTEETKIAGYTPDSPMYGLERAMERLKLVFAGSDDAKARLHVQYAYERMLEARLMEQKGKPQYTEKMVEDYNNEVASAEAAVAKMESRGQNTTEIRAHVQEMTSKHIAVLQRVMENAPESAKPALQQAINNSYQRQVRMQEKWEGNDQEQGKNSNCTTAENCELSLCDCECYKKGQTPEALNGTLCGINCLAEYNVSDCECTGGQCKGMLAENGNQSDNNNGNNTNPGGPHYEPD